MSLTHDTNFYHTYVDRKQMRRYVVLFNIGYVLSEKHRQSVILSQVLILAFGLFSIGVRMKMANTAGLTRLEANATGLHTSVVQFEVLTSPLPPGCAWYQVTNLNKQTLKMFLEYLFLTGNIHNSSAKP